MHELDDFQTDDLVTLLVHLNLALDPYELLGMCFGIAAGMPHAPVDALVQCFADTWKLSTASSGMSQLDTLFHIILKHYHQESLEGWMLLPEDTDPIERRIDALGLFARGFLEGFQCAGVDAIQLEGDDILETLDDLQKIAEVGFDAQANEEDNENAYLELVEYLKLIPLAVFTDMVQKRHEHNSSTD